ncbi:MAG: FAD-binding oxidoreductase [Chloroflexi bacterium]|nr:FAD-binding oxidoreductase [Chloroflexota bacterium]
MAVAISLPEPAVAELRGQLRGPVLTPTDAGYDVARRVWNGMIDKHPGLVAQCAGVADVIAAVNFARAQDLVVAVRGGGHSAAGLGTCDDGLLIDLSAMKGMQVDPVARTARAQAGQTWADFDHETQAFGLATTGGTVSNTGISGLTLGGGVGWLQGMYGFACDNLRSADVVTADGRFVRASAEEEPELFWALRGGGGNFGVVTSFEFNLHPVGPMVLGGMVVHPMAQAQEVMRFYRDFSSSLPDAAELWAALLTSPDGQPVVVLLFAYNGPPDEGERVLEPARTFGSPVVDTVAPLRYVQRQLMIDEGLAPHGPLRYWKSGLVREVTDDLIDLTIEQYSVVPSPMSVIGFFNIHGAASRVDPQATAFGLRALEWDVSLISQWIDPDESDRNVRWTRGLWADVAPFTSGVYVNHIAADEPSRVHVAFGPNYERLAAAKQQYDPTNLFRLNHNIAPRA